MCRRVNGMEQLPRQPLEVNSELATLPSMSDQWEFYDNT